jgi:hypothetical protein
MQTGSGMLKDWKISTFNGALVAAYLIPTWAIPSFRIVVSPVHGLFYERANVAAALFVSDYLQLGALATVRFAWLLAIAKLTVVGFFAVFVALTVRVPTRLHGASDEALGLAVALGGVVSFVSMILASKVGEAAALRLHATELLLLLSIAIVMAVETPAATTKPAAREAADAPLGGISLPQA